MADSINAQGLTFNPAFLQAMNTLSHLSDVAFANGEAGLHFCATSRHRGRRDADGAGHRQSETCLYEPDAGLAAVQLAR